MPHLPEEGRGVLAAALHEAVTEEPEVAAEDHGEDPEEGRGEGGECQVGSGAEKGRVEEQKEEGGLILDYGFDYLEVVPNLNYPMMEVVERLSDGENVMHTPSGYRIWKDIMVDGYRVGYRFDGEFDYELDDEDFGDFEKPVVRADLDIDLRGTLIQFSVDITTNIPPAYLLKIGNEKTKLTLAMSQGQFDSIGAALHDAEGQPLGFVGQEFGDE